MTVENAPDVQGLADDKAVDLVIVGAGFAGLYMLHRARQAGLTTRVFEAGDGVGGTWYWNRYPGARCDVESVDYCYSFDPQMQQEWSWTERFSAQPEILRYINWVADRLELRDGITLNSRVLSAEFDAAKDTWNVTTDTGETVRSRWVVLASGSLSAAKIPDIPGLADYRGTLLHTATWPVDGIDLTGKTVGVIGTGSSGIQAIPEIAKRAGHLTVFQRTPAFSIPARNHPLDPEKLAAFKTRYDEHRALTRKTRPGVIFRSTGKSAHEFDEAERTAAYEDQWRQGGADFPTTFTDLITDRSANDTAADFVREKIAATVKDPVVADALMPRDFPLGTKRICLDSDYYETFNRANVSLIDLRRDPLDRVTATGIKTRDREYPLDVLVLATGFDAMTGSIMRIDIKGVGGASLRDAWAAGPRTYLGLMSAGFPNLFMVTGPGSPSVLTNMVAAIEQHVDWIADCIAALREAEHSRIEPTEAAVDDWVAGLNKMAAATLFMQGDSWYLGANVPGKPRVFMPYLGGLDRYRTICDSVAAAGYEGFEFGEGRDA